MKIVLSPNPYRDRGLKTAQAAEKILREAGAETCMSFPFSLERGNVEVPSHIQFLPQETALPGRSFLSALAGTAPFSMWPKMPSGTGSPFWG